MRNIAAATLEPRCSKNFQSIVEVGGVADAIFENVKPILRRRILAQHAFARARPAAVRADRIDFAIMRDKPERLRELPGRLVLVE